MSQSQPPPALATLSVEITFLLLGIYGWEYFQSLDVEYAVLCGRSSFRAPLIPYVVGRLSLFCYFILHVVQSGPFPMPPSICDPGALFISLLAAIVLGCSSTIFIIRTWLIWKDSRLVHALQVLLAVAQWTLLVFDAATSLKLISIEGVCSLIVRYPKVDAACLIYTMCLDFFILVLSVVGLAKERSVSPLKQRLHTQGVLYVAIAGISYIPLPVIVMLNKEDKTLLLDIFTNIALVASTIVASRSVRSLLSLKVCSSSETEESNVAPMTSCIAMETTRSKESAHV